MSQAVFLDDFLNGQNSNFFDGGSDDEGSDSLLSVDPANVNNTTSISQSDVDSLDDYLGIKKTNIKTEPILDHRVTVPLETPLDSSSLDSSSNHGSKRNFDNPQGSSQNGNSRNSKSLKTGADKTAADGAQVHKKPGRKLDPNMPVNKRKAQNRAAQRAFRERKEQHLKDLEDRVEELEQEAAATIDENQVLRQQVDRLQEELKSYKALYSLHENSKMTSAERAEIASRFKAGAQQGKFPDTSLSETSSISRSSSRDGSTSGSLSGSVSFDFPFFSEPATKSKPSGIDAVLLNETPNSSSNLDFSAPTTGSSSSPLSAIDSLSNKMTTKDNKTTTPESSAAAPIHDTEEFCEQLSWACGNSKSPVPKTKGEPTPVVDTGVLKWPSPSPNSASLGLSPVDTSVSGGSGKLFRTGSISNDSAKNSSQTPKSSNTPATPPSDLQFSPSSFTADVLGDLANPLFDGDAFGISDYTASDYTMFNPLENPIINSSFSKIADYNSQCQLKTNPAKYTSGFQKINAVKETQDDDDLIPDDSSKFIGCEDVWDRLSSHPKFGDVDIESLCFELRTKAKCGDTGAIVSEDDLNKTVNRLLQSDSTKKFL